MGRHYKIKIFFLVTLLVFGFRLHTAQAAIKDTDVDGLSDEAEVNIYHTDPLKYDTDGDGRGDGDEVLDGTNPLDANSSWISKVNAHDVGLLGSPKQFTAYLGQVSGILVFILLTGAAVFGLILSALAYTRFVPSDTIYEANRFISWMALGTIFLYFINYSFDSIFKTEHLGVIMPLSLFRDNGTAPDPSIVTTVALSIIVFYFILALIFTSRVRAKISLHTWHIIRYASFVAYLLFVFNSSLSGSASHMLWMRILYSASLAAVLFLVLVRVYFRNILPAWQARRAGKNDVPPTPQG
jgi:hypothetical protein